MKTEMNENELEINLVAALKRFADENQIDPPAMTVLLCRFMGRVIRVNSKNNVETGENICAVIKLLDSYARKHDSQGVAH